METPTTIASPARSSRRRAGAKIVVFYVLVGLTLLACFLTKPPGKVSEAGVSMRLPETLLGIAGQDEAVSEGERVLLPPDTEIVKKRYSSAQGDSINLQIVLSGVDRRSIHRPEICLSGQGWRVRSGEVKSVPLKSGRKLDVMVLDISRPIESGGRKSELEALYAYWFVSSSAETPLHFERIARTSLDLLLHNRTHRWAYVIVTAPILKGHVSGGKDREETWRMLETAIQEAVPQFQKSEMPAPPQMAQKSAVSSQRP